MSNMEISRVHRRTNLGLDFFVVVYSFYKDRERNMLKECVLSKETKARLGL